MPTPLDSAAFANDNEARMGIAASMIVAALAIINEDPTTPDHDARVTLARAIVQNPASHIERFAWLVSTNATVVDAWVAGDKQESASAFQFVVNSVWNAVAVTE